MEKAAAIKKDFIEKGNTSFKTANDASTSSTASGGCDDTALKLTLKYCHFCLEYYTTLNRHKDLNSPTRKIQTEMEHGIYMVKSAFDKKISTYRFMPGETGETHINIEDLFPQIKETVRRLLAIEIMQKNPIKLNFELFGRYAVLSTSTEKDESDNVDEYGMREEVKSFNNRYEIVTISSDFDAIYSQFLDILKTKTEEFQNRGLSAIYWFIYIWTNTHVHQPHSFCYFVKCAFDDSLSFLRQYRGKDSSSVFVKWLTEDVRKLYGTDLEDVVAMAPLSEEELLQHETASDCFICGEPFPSPLNNSVNAQNMCKVRDHDHILGTYRGAAHTNCNLNYKIRNFVPVTSYFNKPVYIGFSVLDISKTTMYSFHYDHIKKLYGNDNAKLLYTDTESLIYSIKTEDVYADIKKNISKFYTSNYKPDNPYGIPLVNKAVLGCFKDEVRGRPMLEFLGLRSKLYDYVLADNTVVKKAKSIKKCVTKRLHHSAYSCRVIVKPSKSSY
ncbi:hypothetical protein NQ315_002711 [Exocentrus adspersus]|uniref:DNA-directed DNA polymerase n=1 Tax=Exocentrus adspersus TaxID=1586481 RepID=A0AAV8VIJ7_9CUCU|nr:hypothetical protein NQ315_002711 [Exocentrus adspersus]